MTLWERWILVGEHNDWWDMAKGSQPVQWFGLPKHKRKCMVCGGPITLKGSGPLDFRYSELDEDGDFTVRHMGCPRPKEAA